MPMNMKMNNFKTRIQILRILILLSLLLCLPLTSYASQLIYTIQAGSFLLIDNAQEQFNFLVQLINEKEIDHLRIEKIGKFYSVRLGKFDKRYEAEKSLKSMKERYASFLIMKAYYKEERIEKIYTLTKTETDASQTIVEPPERPLPVNIQPRVAEKVVINLDKKTDENTGEKEIEATSEKVEKKKDEDVLAAMKAKLTVRPEDPDMNGRYGTILFRLKQPEEAIPYLRKAAELSPGVPDYHISIGYCFIMLSRFNEAVDEFNRAVTMSPSHVGALTGLGISYSELGEKDKAMSVYDKLKKLDSVLTEILLQIIEET